MKKLMLIVLAVVVLGLGGLFGAAALRPDTYHFERSVETSAAVPAVYAIVSDLNRYDEWNPWGHLDPNLRKAVAGQPGTVGQSYEWEGNDDVGAGKMTIKEVRPNEAVLIDLAFLRPFPSNALTTWGVTPTASGTKITWAMDGRSDGLMHKVFALVAMESMLGRDFDRGLGMLKAVAEK